MNALGALALGCLLSVAGCRQTTGTTCTVQDAAKIEAAYVAEALHVCAGKTYATCEGLPALREKYRAKRREFILCRP